MPDEAGSGGAEILVDACRTDGNVLDAPCKGGECAYTPTCDGDDAESRLRHLIARNYDAGRQQRRFMHLVSRLPTDRSHPDACN